MVYSGLVNGSRVIFLWPYIFKLPPEIWRFITSFLLSGPQLGIILDPYFSRLPSSVSLNDTNRDLVWNYGCALEKESPRFTIPGEFFTYIMFVGSVILVSLLSFSLNDLSSS